MKKFTGVFTALVTPFDQGQVDYNSLDNLVNAQIKDGVQGFVINGTTAESPTLNWNEVEKIFSFIRDRVSADFPLVVGSGSNSTAQTIDTSIEAQKLGAHALLIVVPYYNKPTQRGLYLHFRSIAERVNIPVILYNVPGRTITTLEVDTVVQLSKIKNIIGIKEASGKIEVAKALRKACGENFLLLSGDDATYDEFMLAGGDGIISVASHIVPSAMLKRQIKANLVLINLLFSEANPIPVKKALQLMGLIKSAELRLPLTELSPEAVIRLRAQMQVAGLL